ncbi:MAG: hypothetical protein D6696_04000, partial [Acidobacteria bacterium]
MNDEDRATPDAVRRSAQRWWLGLGAATVTTALIVAVLYWRAPERRLERALARGDKLAAARISIEIALRDNPDYERVDEKSDERIVTIRNAKTGEEMTLDVEAVAGVNV